MAADGPTHRFDPFELDTREFRLLRRGRPVDIAPKAMDLLMLLVARRGSLVTKDDITRTLWADVAVTDNAVAQIVADVRRALGDAPAAPRFVETVPRRGYRFIAAVASAESSTPAEPVVLPAAFRAGVRETASLGASRAFADGRLKLERMDADLAREAVADFERALALDPRYAVAYVGLAHARFWLFEASRPHERRDIAMLTQALADAHRAIDLDPDLAEAHAALALILMALDRPAEAQAAGRRAAALEPGNWRNHCRHAVAAWGTERLEAFARVLDLYPAFAFAYYGQAMVHVARYDLDRAGQTLAAGTPFQDRGDSPDERLPGKGLHWLLGLIQLARGDADGATREFDRELATGGRGVYAAEFDLNARDGHGFAALARGDAAGACAWFDRALTTAPTRARALIGAALAHRDRGDAQASGAAFDRAAAAIDDLHQQARRADASMALAALHLAQGRSDEAVGTLDCWLTATPPGWPGWMLPIDPLFVSLTGDAAFQDVLQRVAARAR